ncbi:MAG: hypothetical protein Q9223_001135 [Gallowayella weberi]
MLSSYRLHPLSGIVLSSIFLPCFVSAATGQGSVSLYSDNGCNQFDGDHASSQPVVIAENYTIEADTCGVLPRSAHSYRVTQHPTCSNGGQGYFTYFTSNDCQTKKPLPAAKDTPTGNTDGLCLSLVDFSSLAFICGGKAASSNTFNKDSTSTRTSTAPSPTATMTTRPSTRQDGSVSLFSDSSCNESDDDTAFSQPPVIALNHTSPADTCYTLPRSAHSYRIDRRPTCANGTTAGFAYYSGDNCQVTGERGSAFNSIGSACDASDDSCTRFDGYCLALVTFKSIAFLCNGVDGSSSSSDSSTPSPPSSNTYTRDSTSTSALVLDQPHPTPTPTSSRSIATTSPFYPSPFTSYTNGSSAPPNPSLLPSSLQTGSLPPSAPFTGDAGLSRRGVSRDSLLSVVVALAFGVVVYRM